ncbi:arsenite methyltransferase-like [Physella acuta]|uniref:arsenite methyltransferase-like n=1 Tax=Physella acuta TaxID=109671 RepID=UPI0027DE663B|nr:arsenite methyltransferase-like [Physella acuta]XP_059162889.1 arsenite methyltransferase-like [Physella acuta]XP_059162890.1 arsenite methyltransferase-like [Physella acuta]
MADAAAPNSLNTEEVVKNYYGKKLNASSDLKTGACTSQPCKYPKFIRDAMSLVHEEVTSKYYGCGPVFPPALKGASVLDLGSGSGQDCYILSKLVGPDGSVTGLDMTDEQLAVANKYIDYHTQLFGYSQPNISFVKGYMEKMEEAGIENNKFDIIVSNCVINLSQDKRAVLKEAYRTLKTGGELYFSDVYADRDLPPEIRNHEELWCECVVGALYWKDLYKLAKEIGFSTPRLVTAGLFSIDDKDYKDFLGEAKFVSATYSLFKLPSEPVPESTVVYNGEIEGYEEQFAFDHGITFKKGEECHVKPELANILTSSRYRTYFSISPGEKGPCKCAKLDKDPFDYCTERGNKKGCC